MVRGDGLSSRAIEGFGGGWPSHMANVLDDGTVWDARDDLVKFGEMVYPSGVQKRPLGYLYAEYKEWAIFEAPVYMAPMYGDWVEALESQVGKPYDSVGIMDFVEGIFTGNYEDYDYAPDAPQDSKAWFCDEYAVWAAGSVEAIPKLPPELPVFTLTPGSALNLFIGAGWEMVDHRGMVKR